MKLNPGATISDDRATRHVAVLDTERRQTQAPRIRAKDQIASNFRASLAYRTMQQGTVTEPELRRHKVADAVALHERVGDRSERWRAVDICRYLTYNYNSDYHYGFAMGLMRADYQTCRQ